MKILNWLSLAILVFVATCGVIGYVQGALADECKLTFDRAKEVVAGFEGRDNVTWHDIDGGQRFTEVLGMCNAEPPHTEFFANIGGYYTKGNGSQALVMFGMNGCYVFSCFLPVERVAGPAV